ncbi:MAG: ATP-binding response regulator [Cognatishimia activa]
MQVRVCLTTARPQRSNELLAIRLYQRISKRVQCSVLVFRITRKRGACRPEYIANEQSLPMKNSLPIELSTIVLVEDDEDTLVALSDALVDEGLVCRPFARPEDALEYISEGGDCSALVTDIKMPKMSGLQLVSKLRDLPNPTSETPVIIASGNATKKEVQEALRLSVSEFLDKPIQLDYLVDLLRQMLTTSRSTTSENEGDLNETSDNELSNTLRLVAHEMRTPLNAVIGFSSLLLDEQIKFEREAVMSVAEYIFEAGNELLSKTNLAIGTLSMSEGNPPELKAAHAERMMVSVTERKSVRDAAKQKHIEIIDHIGLKLWRLDPYSTMNALEQIILNSLNVTEPGGKIVVEARERENGLEIRVTDEGPGMSPAQIERALRPFSKSDLSKNGVAEGLGLGLPFARKCMERQAGNLRVSSSVANGTTVSLELPKHELLPENPQSLMKESQQDAL